MSQTTLVANTGRQTGSAVRSPPARRGPDPGRAVRPRHGRRCQRHRRAPRAAPAPLAARPARTPSSTSGRRHSVPGGRQGDAAPPGAPHGQPHRLPPGQPDEEITVSVPLRLEGEATPGRRTTAAWSTPPSTRSKSSPRRATCPTSSSIDISEMHDGHRHPPVRRADAGGRHRDRRPRHAGRHRAHDARRGRGDRGRRRRSCRRAGREARAARALRPRPPTPTLPATTPPSDAATACRCSADLTRRWAARPSTGSSSGWATPASSTPARATTSARRSSRLLAERHGDEAEVGPRQRARRRGAVRRPARRARVPAHVHERVGSGGPGAGAPLQASTIRRSSIVVHDELDLPPGARAGQGRRRAGRPQRAAQRRRRTSSTQDFLRVRIGVGKPPSKEQRRRPRAVEAAEAARTRAARRRRPGGRRRRRADHRRRPRRGDARLQRPPDVPEPSTCLRRSAPSVTLDADDRMRFGVA